MDYDLDAINSMSYFPWTNMTISQVLYISRLYFEEQYDPIVTGVDAVVRTLLCLSGIIGHALTLPVLSDKEFQNTSGWFLRYLAIADIVFCASEWVYGVMGIGGVRNTNWFAMNFFTHFLQNLRGTVAYFSDLTTLALTFDRIAALWFFYSYRKMSTKDKKRLVHGLLLFLFMGSFILQIGFSISVAVEAQVNSRGDVSYVWVPRPFYLNGPGLTWELVTTIYYEIILNSLTFISGVIILAGIYRLNKRHFSNQGDKDQRRRELRICFLSLALSVLMLIMTGLDFINKFIYDTVTSTMDTGFDYGQSYEQALNAIRFFRKRGWFYIATWSWAWTLVHGANFYLYLILHRRFRRILKTKVIALLGEAK